MLGKADLYISHKGPDGNWQPVRHLSPPLNSGFVDYCPHVTQDKRYLIFTSNRLRKALHRNGPVTYERFKHLLTEPGNGYDSLYGVRFDPG